MIIRQWVCGGGGALSIVLTIAFGCHRHATVVIVVIKSVIKRRTRTGIAGITRNCQQPRQKIRSESDNTNTVRAYDYTDWHINIILPRVSNYNFVLPWLAPGPHSSGPLCVPHGSTLLPAGMTLFSTRRLTIGALVSGAQTL